MSSDSAARSFPPNKKPRLNRDVYVLAVVAFFVMLGFGVVVPVLPVFVRSFDVGYLEVGAVLSAFAFMRMVFSPFCGWLIKRGGERTILAIGIGIVAVSSALVGVGHTYTEVLLMRGAGGIGSAMFTVSAMTLLLGNTPASMRGRALSFYRGGFLIGGMAGPAFGGLLAMISLRAPFFFYAGTLAVAGLVGLLMLHHTTNTDTGSQTVVRPFRDVARDPRFQTACLANLAQGWAGMGVRSALVPVLVVEVLHHDELWTGIAFAIASVVQTAMLVPAGRMVDRYGRRPAIIGSYTLGAASIVLMPFVGELWMLVLLLALYGIASAFISTAPAAAVGDAAGGRSGTPVAVFSMFADFGAIVGPLVAGMLADGISYGAAFGLAALLLLAAALYAFRMPRRERAVGAV